MVVRRVAKIIKPPTKAINRARAATERSSQAKRLKKEDKIAGTGHARVARSPCLLYFTSKASPDEPFKFNNTPLMEFASAGSCPSIVCTPLRGIQIT